MSKKATINIDMDKNCSGCGKPGTTDNGMCLECTGNAIVPQVFRPVARAIRQMIGHR